ncbi:MAG: YcnI family copper-binding membrane protein [Rhizobiaceae bacterium]
MIRVIASAALCAAFIGLSANSLHAHATLEVQQAPANSFYKAVIRTPHGCSGSPTIAVRVQIPEGATGAKPQPKWGWEVETVTEELAEPFTDGHGNTITSRVSEVHWTGGRLLDEHYDEFVVRVRLPNTPDETLYFATVQECEEGADRWIEIPAEGQSARDLDYPAPRVTLTAPN